jgi:arabinan endo-1,5-alpha-L-arabinosidase
MSQQSILPRFITAMIVSILFTGATFLPLLAIIGHAVSVTQAAPIAYTVPVPVSQVLSPPPAISVSYHDPESCFGNCSWTHDPSIVYKDETYWRFTTSGNIAVHTSRFLEGPWKYRGALLQNGTKIHLRDDQDIWVSSTAHTIVLDHSC